MALKQDHLVPEAETNAVVDCSSEAGLRVAVRHAGVSGALFSAGLGCPTTLSPEGAAQFAAQIFGLNNHLVWAKLRANMLNTWVSLKLADKKLRECTL